MNKERILHVLKEQKGLLQKQFHVKRIGLFGSFARNEATDKSDIDLIVEFDAPLSVYIRNRYLLGDHLKQLFKRDIDLANPDSLKPFYRTEILEQAVYA